MAQHTKEPWHVETGLTEHYVFAGAVPVARCQIAPAIHHGRDREEVFQNARRIEACVNACAGIPVEALEAGALKEALAALLFAAQPMGLARHDFASWLRRTQAVLAKFKAEG